MKVIVNGLTIKQAIGACALQGLVPTTTLYSRVQTARQRGTYNGVQIKRSWQEERNKEKLDIVIDITANSPSTTNISPVTMSSTSMTSASQSTKRTRRSSKQASEYCLQSKRTKVEYDSRYKEAFKNATNLIAAKTPEPVEAMCQRLNKAFDLDGKRRLSRSTVYRA